MPDPSIEARVAVLEQVASATKSDLDSMKQDLRELNINIGTMNIKMTQLITAATVSKKLVGAGLALIGVVWPIVYGLIFLYTR